MAVRPVGNYKTAPLKSWPKAKELRNLHYKNLHAAKEMGWLRITGGVEGVTPLLAGLGDFAYLGAEPWGATIATDPVFSQQCAEVMESKNYARDLCSYMRNYWGSMILNKSPFGGPFPKPDFCFQTHFCDSHAKWFQTVSEYFNVPYYGVDLPPGPYLPGRTKVKADYVAAQLLDAIPWMEKVTGRKYDDEKLFQAVDNEVRACSLWAEICAFNKAIPAPLDQKSIFSLYVMAVLMRHEKCAVDFYTELRDEVKDRVANKIAALPTERCRLMDDSQPLWYFLDIYRYFEKYGAIVIGSIYSFGLMGAWEMKKDGTLVAKPVPKEKFKSREQAVHHLAEMTIARMSFPSTFYGPIEMQANQMRVAKQWSVDGMVYHLNRGCEGSAMGQMENRIAFLKAGIPTMTYEGNMGDRREFNEAQTIDRIDAFMESMGLNKLTK